MTKWLFAVLSYRNVMSYAQDPTPGSTPAHTTGTEPIWIVREQDIVLIVHLMKKNYNWEETRHISIAVVEI